MTLSASSLGLRFLTPYYLPLITSLMLILRCVLFTLPCVLLILSTPYTALPLTLKRFGLQQRAVRAVSLKSSQL